ncbi:MAG: type II toxin-antitoxin system PemK/MazF family toxin [Thermodesulfobacteriota bacterium]|nr:type II toxin-antitoxin system PemK/MazF family toxin [Thermodesulfobacteriota bacterium]
MIPLPDRGDVWLVDLNPVRGHEQAGTRPALVISVDLFNHGPAGLVVVLPITSKDKDVPFHIAIAPPQGGLSMRSFVKCEDIRSISKDRLVKRIGSVPRKTLLAAHDRLRILLDL